MSRRAMLLAITLFGVAQSVNAEPTVIRLSCHYKHWTVGDEVFSQTFESKRNKDDLFVVTYSADGRATIRKEGLESEFTGTINPDKITGQTTHAIVGGTATEAIDINRYTGEIVYTYRNSLHPTTLVTSYGTCRRLAETLF